ncbi:MAG: hypothetical protein ACFFB2_20310 [Promethearchaeota archaeon]
MFRKRARHRRKTDTPYLQRFHCRVFITDKEFIIVSGTETDPNNLPSVTQSNFQQRQ